MAKPKKPPKLTDAERYKRFVEMAREVEASEDEKAFEKAFKRVTRGRSTRPGTASGGKSR